MNTHSNIFISVGIDVAADFSVFCIMAPSHELFCKPFTVVHNDLDSIAKAVSTIKKAEERFQMTSQIFLESTGIYHFPLFCHLKELGYKVHVLNPLITNSNKNSDIRKVKNDKFDAVNIAKLGLDPKTKKSIIPNEFVLNMRILCREYYSLADDRTALINKLSNYVRLAFPAFIGIFSDIAGDTSLAVLNFTSSLDQLSCSSPDTLKELIGKAARKGKVYADNKYNAIMNAITVSKSITASLSNIFPVIHSVIKHIALIDEQQKDIEKMLQDIIDANQDNSVIKQILLIDSIPGVGFLSAVTIMCEIGDFNAFNSPKQLFAYFGLDPSVNDSGKFKGTRNHMSKRGSKFARRVIYTIALASIRNKTNGLPINSVLKDYYNEKTKSKLKKVALGAVMHKICKIIFAVLRDDSEFILISPEQHVLSFKSNSVGATA